MKIKLNKSVFLFTCTFFSLVCVTAFLFAAERSAHEFNGPYAGKNLDRVAFPIGGIGAGMFCLEGTGAVSHVSIRNQMEFFNEPRMFAAVCAWDETAKEKTSRVVEGPIPDWKYFGGPNTGMGLGGSSYGLPRFRTAEFFARFPFATIKLTDAALPLAATIVGWSPFTPGDADSSSLPVGALEYTFRNTSEKTQKCVFSYNVEHFLGSKEGCIAAFDGGFILYAKKKEGGGGLERKGTFAVFVDGDKAAVDHCWFRGGWFDAMTVAWSNIAAGNAVANPPVADNAPGASLFVPFTLKPGEEKTVRLLMCWYFPETGLRVGTPDKTHSPWYSGKFNNIAEVAAFWQSNYAGLKKRSETFRDAFYDTTLPPEVVEAVAANLTILKSPTVLRQPDGRLWCWEGCCDGCGCCAGSCTHVWNYAQALCHLFPDLERGLRQTEFNDSQDENGRQAFRANLPISPGGIAFDASDGQLGGIMKAYREWRISGDNDWLTAYWPKIKKSLDYCIRTWDPRRTGLLEESHHNTYDINYFGPDGHCGSFYLGALAAAVEMGKTAGDDISLYQELLAKGKRRMTGELYNGEYFIQIVQKSGLKSNFQPLDPAKQSKAYVETAELINRQGPVYQYGEGCLSDGVLGFWMAAVCGLDMDILDKDKIRNHLLSVYKYNFKKDLSAHANPQRPTYALGDDGGLLLCSWPRGNKPLLPFVYSDEVWTGIEYQVASHLMLLGHVEEGLEIVRACRKRHDGVRRNPFDEYECGHWYARAMSSYGLLQGLTGMRYDAVDKTLYVQPRLSGDFRCFLATATGYGTAGMKDGKPFLEVKEGKIDCREIKIP